jgi:polyisoprenoid-binding protein YceI
MPKIMQKNIIIAIAVLAVVAIAYAVYSQNSDKKSSDSLTQTKSPNSVQTASNNDSGTLTDGQYQIKPDQSTMNWYGKKILVATEHHGTIAIKSGSLTIADSKLSGGSFVIDMTTINDLDLDAASKVKLEGHLQSADFFNTTAYPEATLTIKQVTPVSGSTSDYNVIADLQIKDKTNEVSFQTSLSNASGLISAEAKFNIDRTLWDIRYGSGKFFEDLGDKVIDDTIRFEIKLVAQAS